MKSHSGSEAVFFTRPGGRIFPVPILLAVVLSAAVASASAPGSSPAAVSVTEMARIEAADAKGADNTLLLFNGYMALGLYPEAASLLERRVRTGGFPATEAREPFHRLIEAQAGLGSPEGVLAACETALRSGVRTSRVLYHYGAALRSPAGRPGEASAVLAQVDKGSPDHLPALYVLGQAAADRGDSRAAEELFLRVEREAGGPGGNARLARRAARSRAGILLATARGPEAAPVYQGLLRAEDERIDRIGLATAAGDPVSALEGLPPETVEGLPLEDRVRFLLLLGGLARESGRYGMAADRLGRAEKELEGVLSPAASSRPPDPPVRIGSVEALRTQVERLRSLRKTAAPDGKASVERSRAETTEMLAGLLLADRTVTRAAEETRSAGLRFLTADEIGKIMLRIEDVTLDGIEVDRMVEQLSATLEVLQNLGHPIHRYRALVRLEKSQKEIHALRLRIRERRTATAADVASPGEGDGARFLRDLGLYLSELDTIRSASAELREFTRQYLGILRKKKALPGETADPLGRAIREADAEAGRLMERILPGMKAFEEAERAAARERERPRWIALRAAVARELAAVHLAEARVLRHGAGAESRGKALDPLRKAVSILSEGRLPPGEAFDVAVQAGSLLAEGEGRWTPYPGWVAGEQERGMIARILPFLPADPPFRPGREESFYLQSALRQAVKDPGATAAARGFVAKEPASRSAAEISVRLGHEALLAGDVGGATARYRAAAGGGPETSAVGRAMLAWIRVQAGDADDAVRELSGPLSDPAFPCVDPSPFERTVLALSVRAWQGIPPARLDAYPPVKAGMCGGKALLAALWLAEEKRGNPLRASEIFDITARRFPGEEGLAALEKRTVDALLNSGRERDALDRVLGLRGKYGPGSTWAQSQNPSVRDRTFAEMASLLRNLSERKFEEGMRTGERSDMASSAALMREYFAWKGGAGSEEDEPLRLKYAIALTRSGDREGGLRLLSELARKSPGGATGERAGILYAEAMVAGYERKEAAAAEAEEAVLLLLSEHPSEKAVAIALRASAAFLANREFAPAERTARGVEGSRFATRKQATMARMDQAEAALSEGKHAEARAKAAAVMADPAEGRDGGDAHRARDLYLLASLKEIDGKAAAGDPKGAALMLEELSGRFPDAPEAPAHILRAMRLYAQGGDPDSAVRTGYRFLREYPRRGEALEVAALVGPLLEERKDFAAAGDLYENVSSRFPKSEESRRFLFHAARLAEIQGPPGSAERRFSDYAARYPVPAWMWAYATLSVGLEAGRRGDAAASARLLEEGLRKADSLPADGVPRELADRAGQARIAVGENWAVQFRKTRLVIPLEKSLAVKDRLFRLALGAFTKAEEGADLDQSLLASRLAGDLFLDYGKAILDSQRPAGLSDGDRVQYEEALRVRARSFFERSLDRYSGALARLEKEGGTPGQAEPIRKRLGEAQAMLSGDANGKEGTGK